MASNPRTLNGVASPLSAYETSTTQHHRIGARGQLDNRVFHYSRLTNATGVVANNLCQQPAATAAGMSQSGAAAYTAGATTIAFTLGSGTAVANFYEDGYLKIQSSTLGAGQIYRVKKHAASVLTALTVELYDPVVTTATGTVVSSIQQNMYADAIITPVTTLTGMLTGVPLVAVPAATAAAPVYFWMQTWGPTSVLGDTTDVTVGGAVKASAVVGSSALFGLDGNALTQVPQTIGIAMETITTNTIYQSVFLTIAP